MGKPPEGWATLRSRWAPSHDKIRGQCKLGNCVGNGSGSPGTLHGDAGLYRRVQRLRRKAAVEVQPTVIPAVEKKYEKRDLRKKPGETRSVCHRQYGGKTNRRRTARLLGKEN